MKNLFALLFLFVLAAASCSKEYVNPTKDVANNNDNGNGNGGGSGGGSGGGGGGGSTIGAVPLTFSQKAVIEEFTGEWCGYCPDGALIVEDVEAANPGKVYGVSVHNGDPYTIAFDAVIEATLDNSYGFPGGAVNRIPYGGSTVFGRGSWGSAASTILGTSTSVPCGLAMSSYTASTDSLYIEVHAGFNTSLSGDYRLTVYLVEDAIHSLGAQSNYYNVVGAVSPDNAALNNIGNPIVDWTHNNVLRKVVSADLGDPIPSSKLVAGGEFVVKYGTKYTGFNKNNLSVLAFVNFVGTSSTTHVIVNAQEAKVYEIKNWD